MVLSEGDAAMVARFPDENPNPVLRMLPDGTLVYANKASRPILETWHATVGSGLADPVARQLLDAAAAGRPTEVEVGHQTFELLVVDVPDLGFLNVYGTDVTAHRAIAKFPDQNPNPVFRFRWDGTLAYANPASAPIIAAIGCAVGQHLSVELLEPLLAQVRDRDIGVVEIEADDRIYLLKAVDVPAFGFINVYGTDITAARQLEIAHRENERLLLNILPRPIADRLRAGATLIADRYDDVTLMFADIVEFTRLSSDLSPEALITVLNDVFTVFDDLVGGYGLEKVKTIGDAYMVVGGAPDVSDDHAERVASMAIELAGRVASIEAARRLGVRFRIGIHTGPIVAGVIGTKRFIYDVWGDTVNVASRMESLSVPGRIQVTDAVERRLRDRFVFEPRGIIEVKGKGPMATWFLTGHAQGALA
ncbi:MAG: adenylate/guanylate cyclase domain-containing protein [Candidatus Limnocylindria bacterium]